VARQITLYESSIFKEIKPNELLNLEWTKKENSSSIKLKELILWFNKLSSFVSFNIVNNQNIKKRAKVIEYFIKLTIEFLNIRNFNAIFEIMSGLNNSSIFRLKKSWALVPLNLSQKFEEMLNLIDTKGNFNNLRIEQSVKKSQVLPYLGIFLTDLTFIGFFHFNFKRGGK
jgi:son of sevenless